MPLAGKVEAVMDGDAKVECLDGAVKNVDGEAVEQGPRGGGSPNAEEVGVEFLEAEEGEGDEVRSVVHEEVGGAALELAAGGATRYRRPRVDGRTVIKEDV